jgi:signal transduction histidine kinase
MKTRRSVADRESPARRLGILYVTTLTAVALLSAIIHTLILRELAWQGETFHSIGRSICHRSMNLSALAIQAAQDTGSRPGDLDPLRSAIGAYERRWVSEEESDALLRMAEPHRLAAIRSARAILSLLGQRGSSADRTAEIGALVRQLSAEEGAFHKAIDTNVLQAETRAASRIEQLRTLEIRLFSFVLIVLLLEGLCVVSPAVRKIQLIMANMQRSHEELKIYAGRLERSNKELEDFASVASHDLQEPLRKVQAFSDRLRSRCGAAIDDQGRDYLDRIQKAAGRMQTLINDLLTYARVTTKAQPFVPVDFAAATRDVVTDLEARIEQVRGRIELGDLPTLDADPLQVRQLMQNLIGNALKYHRPETPPVVKVYSLSRPVDRSASLDSPTDERCVLLVEDNGIGFEPIYADRIFTIFQRLHSRTEYEGTGVGLAVCRKIVERHGGTITARSAPGEGSTFTVNLPVRQPKETRPDESTDTPDCHSDRRR